MIQMTEQEKINTEIHMKLAMQDAKFNVFMQEMRDRDNQRAEDIREIRQDIKDMGKHVRNLSLTAMGAIATMVVTVIISLLKS
jgi:uncharacterized protein YfkK (UPF0435 family)